MILYESEIERITLELVRDDNGYGVLYVPVLLEGDRPERALPEVVLQSCLLRRPSQCTSNFWRHYCCWHVGA
ncbi:MAG: hypothetical protein U1B80_03855 [Anaerolineaceae bacterium]|nr:hypothetical protein [Anaerolineaceae bacterium]